MVTSPGPDTIRAGRSARSRILFVIGHLDRGGQERQLYYLLRSLDRVRYPSAVVVGNYQASDVHVSLIKALDVPVYLAGGATRLARLLALRRVISALRPEVVHSYSFHTNAAVAIATCGTGATAVGSVRSDFEWAKKGTGTVGGPLCARWPASQILNSYCAAASIQRTRSWFAPRNAMVVPNGLDLERFNRCAVPSDGVARIVGLGYLLPVKRWDRLLRAAAELKRRGLVFSVAIIGGGPLHEGLQQLATALDVADRVEFIGHTNDIPAVLADSTFVVLTSDAEGRPNAVMEAMACGRAVVATNVGDVATLIEDGRTGFVVAAEGESQLIERMATLIGDRSLCATMGDAARQRAEREFGLDLLVQRTLAGYRVAGWNDTNRQ